MQRFQVRARAVDNRMMVQSLVTLRTNVTIGNLTAIMDTIQVTFGATAILVMITIVLNLIAYKHTKP